MINEHHGGEKYFFSPPFCLVSDVQPINYNGLSAGACIEAMNADVHQTQLLDRQLEQDSLCIGKYEDHAVIDHAG